ncbi:hypothetical protein F5878DRAFT_624252 [Lentinula raphanica]|uniref:PAS domain-containing protein n=1 Tax=Lentinula raphanica TaxID=153919 RepID=A0AA38P665_9AGAR|nr:hypothetical protein F5878DRAFT_624252 [Lentinula raphanica]
MALNVQPFGSFIASVDFSPEAKWLKISPSVSDLLGYEPQELEGRPSLALIQPDEIDRVRMLHHDTILKDKVACLLYVRLRHKDPERGYIFCRVVRTIVHDLTFGSVSPAKVDAKAMYHASTAEEVTNLSLIRELDFCRWHNPFPISPDSEERDISSLTYNTLPRQSFRTALILNRFSTHAPIESHSNNLFITATNIDHRSFFDFVAERDEKLVLDLIDTIKTYGVDDQGQPSDSYFCYGTFTLLTEGRSLLSRRQSRSIRGDATSRHTAAASLDGDSITVDAVFQAQSDGLTVFLRRAVVQDH